MLIKESELDRIFNHTNWAVSLNYHRRGDCIEKLRIDYDETFDLYQIEAVLDIYGHKSNCYITLESTGELSSFTCDCRYCAEDELACAHIGAVLLTLHQLIPPSYPYTYNPRIEKENAYKRWLEQEQLRKSKSFIQQFTKYSEDEFLANLRIDKIKIYVNVKHQAGVFELGYKVGNDKQYVVKNIEQFIVAIVQSEQISYGKKLAFTHHIDSFDDIAKLQISFLRRIAVQLYNPYLFSTSSKRYIKLDSGSIDEFYDLYAGEASDYIDIRFASEDVESLPLSIRFVDEFYCISIPAHIHEFISGLSYWYYFEENCLYRFTKELSQACAPFLEELKTKDEISIHRLDMIDFCKYVLPQIENYVEFDHALLDEFRLQEPFMQSYIDLEESGDVSIKVNYRFEHQPIQPLLQENMDTSIHIDRLLRFIKEYASVIDYDAHVAYVSQDQNLCYQFIKEGIAYLNKIGEVYVSDAIKHMSSPKKASFQVGVAMENNLLKVDVNSVDIPKDELYAVLRSYRKKKTYHRLKNGELIHLQGESIEEVDEFLNDMHILPSNLVNGSAQLEAYRSFELDHMADNNKNITIERNKQFKEMMSSLQDITQHEYPVPEAYVPILRDYQTFGFQWLHMMSAYNFGGILADDMGLGKTLQIITLLDDLKNKGNTTPSIVICPASLILNWEDEVHKFSKTLDALAIHGSSSERSLQIKDICHHDVAITSYDYLRRDYEQYEDMNFSYIILDEAQYIKNHTTKNAFAVKQLKGTHRFALTGTPIENSLAELWSIFDFLMPNYLYTYHYFRSHYERAIVKENDEKKQQKLKKMVEPFILRRLKKDVLTELPEKNERIQYMDFSEEERKIYFANVAQINKELQQKLDMEEFDKFVILAMMTRLRQICCDPRLLYDNYQDIGSKMQGCMDLILSAKSSGKKVLLFSSFTSVLELLEDELLKENVSYLKLTGETKKEKRREYVEQFQSDDTSVFLISLKAGGTGLNLTSAEIVIHYDPWWNMSAQNQATDRAYRIGQTKNIQVYKLIMKDSIEEKIVKLQERKMNLSDTFVSGSDGSITSMSKEDIMDLLKAN